MMHGHEKSRDADDAHALGADLLGQTFAATSETLAVACSHMANTVMLAVYRRCKWPKRILLQCQLTLSLHSAATSNKLLAVRQLS